MIHNLIAIDGLAASGKGTLARALAAALGYAHLETGLLYRAVGYLALDGGIVLDDEAQLAVLARSLPQYLAQNPDFLSLPALRSDEVANAASTLSVLPAVRAALLHAQRDFGLNPPPPHTGAILDGRDIGTIVFPDAACKFFITASAEMRAQRRLKELQSHGIAASLATVLADIEARDARDKNRDAAPMKPAVDAVIIDTSTLDKEQVFQTALAIVRQRQSD